MSRAERTEAEFGLTDEERAQLVRLGAGWRVGAVGGAGKDRAGLR
jgi:hypothetical protein